MGGGQIPIIRLDNLTDDERKAYALVHNKLTMNSDFDIELLGEELSEILEIDMADFGFDSMEDIDWASVEDLNEERYEEPQKDMLQCPHCNHVDSKNHFKKVDGLQIAENEA